jgi:hypothetical protein
MLEPYEADGAFAALGESLAAEGLRGRSGVVADLYLGYGLSGALRRSGVSPPSEPCRVPLLAGRIRAAHQRRQVTTCHLPRGGTWERSRDDEGYARVVAPGRGARLPRGGMRRVPRSHVRGQVPDTTERAT